MKPLYLVIIFFVIASLVILLREYFRKPDEAGGKIPEVSLSATKLISAFEENEDSANRLYLGKWLQVEGNLIGVDTTDKTTARLVLGDTTNLHNVQVELANSDSRKYYSLHKPIVVRGLCTGYLMDVQLNRAAVIDQ